MKTKKAKSGKYKIIFLVEKLKPVCVCMCVCVSKTYLFQHFYVCLRFSYANFSSHGPFKLINKCAKIEKVFIFFYKDLVCQLDIKVRLKASNIYLSIYLSVYRI